MLTVLLLFVCLLHNCQSRLLDDDEKDEAVRVHNLLRRSVVPMASNMRELQYSDKIALVASEYIEKCTFTHMYGPQGYGENGRMASDGNITNSIMNWFQERVYYDWSKPYGERCSIRRAEDDYLSGATCGHYTMFATHTLTKVGCAIKYCPTITVPNKESVSNAYLTFCFYDKGPRDHPYAVGKPCTGCDDMDNQYCRDGLCVKKSSGQNDCKVVCKRCQSVPTWIKGYCGCECNVGENNDCSGFDKKTKDPSGCSPCNSLATPCLNGGTEISSNKDECQCKCADGYYGKQCEVTQAIATNIQNSITINIEGEKWNYGFRYPVDKYEFERRWTAQFKERIRRDIEDTCTQSQCGSSSDGGNTFIIEMVDNFPVLDERGTLILKIYAKKNGQFIDKEILQDVILKNAATEQSYLMGHVKVSE